MGVGRTATEKRSIGARPGPPRRLDRSLRWFGVALAAGLAISGQALLSQKSLGVYRGVIPGGLLYAAAGALLLYRLARQRRVDAATPTDSAEASAPSALPRGLEWGLVALVLLGGLYLRVFRIDFIPWGLNNDEAINALEVHEIVQGRPFQSLTTRGLNRESMFHYLAAFADRHPGPGLNLLRAMPAVFGLQPRFVNDRLMDLVFPLRSVAVRAGLLTILALYLFARSRFGWRVALLAAIFLAVSPWHLLYSRVGLRTILAPLFAIAAVGFFLRAVESGRLRDHLVWGVALGLGFWTFTSIRAIPLALGAFLLLRRFIDPEATASRRLAIRPLLIGAAAAAILLAGLIAFSPIGAGGFLLRGLYATAESQTPRIDYGRNLLASLAMANYFPARYAVIQSDDFISDGVSAVYGLIGLEPETMVTAALATLGLLLAAWRAGAARRRDPACSLVLLCYLGLILTVGLAGPSLTRMLLNLPWMCLFAALLADRLVTDLIAVRRQVTVWVAAAAVGGIASLACVQGFNHYFLQAGRSERAMQYFWPSQTIMGMFVRSLPPGRTIYVLHSRGVDTLEYLIGDRPDVHLVADPTTLDLDAIIRMPGTTTFVVEYSRPFAEALRYLIMRYPEGDMTQVADARLDPEKIIFFTFTLLKDESGRPIPPPPPSPGEPPAGGMMPPESGALPEVPPL
jgi:dolichyl-phosphate-mannose-protein mannosyltransferase